MNSYIMINKIFVVFEEHFFLVQGWFSFIQFYLFIGLTLFLQTNLTIPQFISLAFLCTPFNLYVQLAFSDTVLQLT